MSDPILKAPILKAPILKAQAISKRFTSPAPLELFSDISLTVEPGQSVAIVGKSGEGKTTLLHILGTLDEPTTGSLFFAGEDVKTLDTDRLRNRHIGFVFQAFHLLEDATVLENLLMPITIARLDSREYLSTAYDLLRRLGLFERKSLHALKLSGGEKQRLAIGRAFITNPDIIMADEPTGNLDHATAHDVEDLLFSWVKEQKKALLVVTHSHDLAARCDKRYLLDNATLSPS